MSFTTTCAVSCWGTLGAEVLSPASWLSWRHIFPQAVCPRHGQKPSGRMPGVRLLRAEFHIQLCDGTSEAGEDVTCHMRQGQGEDGNMSLIRDLCATLSWDLMGWLHFCHEICVEHRALWMSLISRLSCHRCSNPATESRRRFTPCHWRHYVLITLRDWWQELKRIIHSPSSCQSGCPLQSSRSGSLVRRKMRLPGQQCPQLRDVSARPAVSSAAGFASSLPSSPGHLSFKFLGDKKHNRDIYNMVKVVMRTQFHSSKQR